MKIRVTHKYAVWMHETHEIEITDPEELEFLREDENNVIEFCSTETSVEKFEGDCVNGTWDLKWKEIPVLDQIVEAINADE